MPLHALRGRDLDARLVSQRAPSLRDVGVELRHAGQLDVACEPGYDNRLIASELGMQHERSAGVRYSVRTELERGRLRVHNLREDARVTKAVPRKVLVELRRRRCA